MKSRMSEAWVAVVVRHDITFYLVPSSVTTTHFQKPQIKLSMSTIFCVYSNIFIDRHLFAAFHLEFWPKLN